MSKKPYKVFSGVPVSQLPWADYGFAIAREVGQKWAAKTQTRHMANKIAKLLNAAEVKGESHGAPSESAVHLTTP